MKINLNKERVRVKGERDGLSIDLEHFALYIQYVYCINAIEQQLFSVCIEFWVLNSGFRVLFLTLSFHTCPPPPAWPPVFGFSWPQLNIISSLYPLHYYPFPCTCSRFTPVSHCVMLLCWSCLISWRSRWSPVRVSASACSTLWHLAGLVQAGWLAAVTRHYFDLVYRLTSNGTLLRPCDHCQSVKAPRECRLCESASPPSLSPVWHDAQRPLSSLPDQHPTLGSSCSPSCEICMALWLFYCRIFPISLSVQYIAYLLYNLLLLLLISNLGSLSWYSPHCGAHTVKKRSSPP